MTPQVSAAGTRVGSSTAVPASDAGAVEAASEPASDGSVGAAPSAPPSGSSCLSSCRSDASPSPVRSPASPRDSDASPDAEPEGETDGVSEGVSEGDADDTPGPRCLPGAVPDDDPPPAELDWPGVAVDDGFDGPGEVGPRVGLWVGLEEGLRVGLGLEEGLRVGLGVAEGARWTGGATPGGTAPEPRSCCHDHASEPPAGTTRPPTPWLE